MMIRSFEIAAALLGLVALTAGSQEPQKSNGSKSDSPPIRRFTDRELGPGVSRPSPVFTSLLKNPLVAEEIELTDEQKMKIQEVETQQNAIGRAYSEEQRRRIEEFKEQNKLDDPANRTIEKTRELNNMNNAMAVGSNQISADFDKKIAREILNKRQAARLKEIKYQAMGEGYFLMPEAREMLALEQDQYDEIWKIRFDSDKQQRAMREIPANATKLAEGATPTPESKLYDEAMVNARKNIIKHRAQTMRAIEQVLTKAQRGTYKALVGKPFSFDKPREEKLQDEESSINKDKKD